MVLYVLYVFLYCLCVRFCVFFAYVLACFVGLFSVFRVCDLVLLQISPSMLTYP